MASALRNVYFWVAILLFAITDILFIGIIFDYFNFGAVIGQYRLNHWIGWIGIIFIAIHIPIFVWVRRKYSGKIRVFLGIHVIGMLLSYLLITIHFASQISRPAEFYPDLGTGVAQYIFMIILIITGFLQRFNLLSKHRKKWPFLHRSSIFALLIIIVFHILHGI
jgi:hypothetical protein